MTANDADTSPPSVNIEAIMQDVREEILSRALPGQAQQMAANRTLSPDFYEHLYRAGLAQSELVVKPPIIKSNTQLVGPLLDRFRQQFHQLVSYYFDHIALQQREINHHILQALRSLEQADGGENETNNLARVASRSGLPARKDEWATPEDVYTCYRLLLDREPDKAGWHYWIELLNRETVPRTFVVDHFLQSPEFLARQSLQHEAKVDGDATGTALT
ncbi:MAG: DUF4214 domain-containing protein [Chloroflexota bacterium]|jgi:hypothetical protein